MKSNKYEKVAVLTLGCSKNLVDSERLIARINAAGTLTTENPAEADVVIINTCGFIESSKAESINLILQAAEQRRRKHIKKLIVFGCLSQRYTESLKSQIPYIDDVLGVETYDEILTALGLSPSGDCGRSLLTPPYSAYLKISEGCNHRCGFCAIPLIRGNYKSRDMKEILAEAKSLARDGVKEINVIAQDTTFYGRDIYGEPRLAELLNHLADVSEFRWIRLLYTYPYSFPLDVVRTIAERGNICNYLDLPLQHISDSVLKSMGRGAGSDKIRSLLTDIKTISPEISLRTTFIVGFPTETEENFSELYNFVQEMKFSRMGVFTYSPEEGTPAFDLGDPISEDLKEERFGKLMELQQNISLEKNKSLVGKDIEVLIEETKGKTYLGRTAADAPEIDNGVIIKTREKLVPGSFITAKVIEAQEYDLVAETGSRQ